jgi:acyl carrier protein
LYLCPFPTEPYPADDVKVYNTVVIGRELEMDPKLKDAIAEELQVDPESLASDTQLAAIENWDSVARLTMMVLLGDALSAVIEPGEIAKLRTFGDIEALVAKKVAT